MRLLGIDYGARRVGVAVSDPNGVIATPHSVLSNDVKLVSRIIAICQAEETNTIILGESLSYAGRPNPIMSKINKLKTALEKENIQVIFEPEYLTSKEAAREIGEDKLHDARAAAIILRNYLEKHHD